MKIKDILNTQIDLFKCSSSSRYIWCQSTIFNFITDLAMKYKNKILRLRNINKVSETRAKEFKGTELIACTISATFNDCRSLEHIKEITGLITIDIDKDKNKDLDTEKAKKEVISLPFVAMTMLSCRGEGIWCLIPYNKENNFRETFDALKEDFLKIGYVIDDCKDETRLRIISWDDNILMRQNEIEIYNKTKKQEIINKENNIEYNDIEWILSKDNLKDIAKAIYMLTTYCNYKSDDYNEWLLDGFRLATIPNKELGLKLFTMISEKSANFKSYKDVENKFNECCRTTKYQTNVLGYYINRIKEYYGNDWKIETNRILKSV